MSKTIKQIADELGVSKTAVRKKMTPEVQTKFAVKVSGVVFIDEEGERLIKQGFSRDIPQTKVSGVSGEVSGVCGNQFAEVSSEISGEVSGQPCQESPLYDILKLELQAKNEQIAILQSELSKERQHSREQAEKIAVLADQAQRLQLAQMRDSPEGLPPISGEPVGKQQVPAPAELKQKKGFWKNIFKKRNEDFF